MNTNQPSNMPVGSTGGSTTQNDGTQHQHHLPTFTTTSTVQSNSSILLRYQKPSLNQIFAANKQDAFLNFAPSVRLEEKRTYRMMLNQNIRQRAFGVKQPFYSPLLNRAALISTTVPSSTNARQFQPPVGSLINLPRSNRHGSLLEKLRVLQEKDVQQQQSGPTLFGMRSVLPTVPETRSRTPQTSSVVTSTTTTGTVADLDDEKMEIDENYFGNISKGTSVVSISDTWENLEFDPELPEAVRKYKELSANYERQRTRNDANNEEMAKVAQQIKKQEVKVREYRDRCRQTVEELNQISKDRRAQSSSVAQLRYYPPCFEIQSLDDEEEESYKDFDSDEDDELFDDLENLRILEKEDQLEVELSDEVLDRVHKVMEIRNMNEKITEKYNSDIRRKDLETLQGLNWLNDEVINFYFNMIAERGSKSVYCFNTFFYSKLRDSGHKALRRWTKKVDIFSYHMILIPVHLGMHWTLAAIDFKGKQINYYDSMNGNNNECLNLLMQYLREESLDKRKQEFDTNGWQLNNVKGIPQQMNGSDCGMFACKYADYLSRGKRFTFSQVSRYG